VNNPWAIAAAEWNTAMTEALLAAAKLNPISVVLDLASGSGEPALTIAERLGTGRVIALDSSLTGFQLADSRARQLGLESNLHCLQADPHAIPLTTRQFGIRCAV